MEKNRFLSIILILPLFLNILSPTFLAFEKNKNQAKLPKLENLKEKINIDKEEEKEIGNVKNEIKKLKPKIEEDKEENREEFQKIFEENNKNQLKNKEKEKEDIKNISPKIQPIEFRKIEIPLIETIKEKAIEFKTKQEPKKQTVSELKKSVIKHSKEARKKLKASVRDFREKINEVYKEVQGKALLNINQKCKEKGILNPKDCLKFLQQSTIDKRCKQANILDIEKCKDYLSTYDILQEDITEEQKIAEEEESEEEVVRPEIKEEVLEEETENQDLPKECIENNILDPIECKRFKINKKISEPEILKEIIKQEPEILKEKEKEEEIEVKEPEKEEIIPKIPDEILEKCKKMNIKDINVCKKLLEVTLKEVDKEFIDIKCKEKGIYNKDECEKYLEKRSLPLECIKQGIDNKDDCFKYIKSLKLPPECKEKGIKDPLNCEKFLQKISIPKICIDNNIDNIDECNEFLKIQTMPRICKVLGIESFEECKSVITKKNLPKECQTANINSPIKCILYLFKKYGKPNGCEGKSEKECIKLVLKGEIHYKSEFKEIVKSIEKIQKENLAKECVENGFYTLPTCQRFLMRFMKKKKLLILPEECKEAQIFDIKECKEFIKDLNFPKECKAQGIFDEDQCEEYIKLIHLPKECREKGIEDEDDCEEFLEKKELLPECLAQGIKDKSACRELLYQRYGKNFICEDLDLNKCKLILQKKLLSKIVKKEKIIAKIQKKLRDKISKHIDFEDKDIEDILKYISVKPQKQLKVLVLKSSTDSVVSKEGEIIRSAPFTLIIDSDEDGVPDDIEKRIGTDPFKKDTDSDGLDDKRKLELTAEIENLSPIDKAIISGIEIEQPIAVGPISKDLKITGIETLPNGEIVLKGKGIPKTVLGNFIYSDVPLLLTVKTTEDGSFEYRLKAQLQDGKHEAYLALTDETGKIIVKSEPYTFFVREAKAITAKEYVQDILVSKESTKKKIIIYIVGTLFLVLIAGIAVFGVKKELFKT